jgi:hypothetical protein
MFKIEGADLNGVVEWIAPPHGVGQRADLMPGIEQAPGDIFSRKSKGPGNDVQFVGWRGCHGKPSP